MTDYKIIFFGDDNKIMNKDTIIVPNSFMKCCTTVNVINSKITQKDENSNELFIDIRSFMYLCENNIKDNPNLFVDCIKRMVDINNILIDEMKNQSIKIFDMPIGIVCYRKLYKFVKNFVINDHKNVPLLLKLSEFLDYHPEIYFNSSNMKIFEEYNITFTKYLVRLVIYNFINKITPFKFILEKIDPRLFITIILHNLIDYNELDEICTLYKFGDKLKLINGEIFEITKEVIDKFANIKQINTFYIRNYENESFEYIENEAHLRIFNTMMYYSFIVLSKKDLNDEINNFKKKFCIISDNFKFIYPYCHK